MTRTFVQLAIVTTALALVGPALAASSSHPAAAKAPPVEPAPAAAQAAGLCGITPSDVASIVDHYQLSPDMDGVADMLAVPFQCSAYGELCSVVGAQNAHVYACTTWTNLRNLESAQYVQTVANDQLESWAPPCTPDLEECAELCEPKGVLYCDAFGYGDNCMPLAVCDDPRLRWLFAFRDLFQVEPIVP